MQDSEALVEEDGTPKGEYEPIDISSRGPRGWCGKLRIRWLLIAVAVIAVVITLAVVFTRHHQQNDSGPVQLAQKLELSSIMSILSSLESIAVAHQNSRSVSLGYNASLAFVLDLLNQEAGGYFDIEVQPFQVTAFNQLADPFLARVGQFQEDFVLGTDYALMPYSGSGSLSNTPVAVPSGAAIGCNISDFTGFPTGHIALVLRGECSFHDKAANAAASQALGVLIYNTEAEGVLFSGTLRTSVAVPVLATTFKLGDDLQELVRAGNTVLLNMSTSTSVDVETTSNLLATTKTGKVEDTLVIGSHLDSVPAGPGINDNGSGSATNLALALLMAKENVQPANRVRFGWWGAEEIGLLGSYHYVNDLVANNPAELARLSANLNYDMLGSPNYQVGVYNGTSRPDIPGCGVIQQVFADYFTSRGKSHIPVGFTGRSDYAGFLDQGISSGGVAAGAEQIKTVWERDQWGGVPFAAYDTCYHQSCDTVFNINQDGLDLMARAAAHTAQTLFDQSDMRQFLQMPPYQPKSRGPRGSFKQSPYHVSDFQFLGPHAVR